MLQLRKIKANKVLFYVGFTIIILRKFGSVIEVLQHSLLNTYNIYFVGITFIIMSAIICQFSFTDFFFIVYGLVSFYLTRDITLLSFLSILIAAKNIVLDEIIIFYYRIQFCILGICILFYPLLRIIGSSLATTSYIAGRFRYNFFFTHPNNFAIQCVFTILAYIYIKRNKFSLKKINIICIITALFLLLFPNSQTATLVMLIYVFMNIVVRYASVFWKYFIRVFIPLFAFTLIYILFQFYNGNTSIISNYITGTFASRFIGAIQGMELYHVNLFGNYISDIGDLIYMDGQWGNLWIDLAYIRMLITYGIIGAGIFYYIFIKSFFVYYKEKNYSVLLLFLSVMLYALSEWTAFSIQTVFPLLFCCVSINKQNRLQNYSCTQ